jgi:tetratricopeptide (TPR) repeat protein
METAYLGVNPDHIARDRFRRLEEAFPLATDEYIDFVMRLITTRLQGYHLHGSRKEDEMSAWGEIMFNTGTRLLVRFMQKGGLGTLQEAVNLLRGALKMFPQGHPSRDSSLSNLANALQTQYEQGGDLSKLTEAVNLHHEALALCPRGHPDRAGSLVNLGIALQTQYGQDGDPSKLTQTVDLHREALSLCPRGHPDRAGSLINLANALRMQYEQDGDLSKLAQTVDLHREALSLCPRGHPGRAGSLVNLAIALRTQYEQDGDAFKLTQTVNLHGEALSLRPRGHPDRAGSLVNVGIALQTQYGQDGDLSKLTQTVDLHREALSLCPRGHPDRAGSLSNLANALQTQYGQDGDLFKLTQTVDLCCEALSLCPQGHSGRAGSLVNLGIALQTQYGQDGDLSKLTQTVDLHREALSLCPQGHPRRGDLLDYLSYIYLWQFERNGDESAIVNTLRLRRQCLDSWYPGHPARHGAHHSIARVQLLASPLFDWAEALDHLMQATTDNNAAPRQRLLRGIETLRLVEHASSRNVKQYFYSQIALDVYIAAIQLLPRVAHAGLDISRRLRELSGSEQLCRAAAMRAVWLGQHSTAVEVFEEGKAVFWSQALRLRSTALDELPSTDSKRLRDIFRSLDAAYEDNPMDGQRKANLERHIEHRRQLNDKADLLIEVIRTRPGFERFLKIPQYAKLAQSATSGFVVALVANEPNHFAIIIQADKDPQHVPLPDANGVMLRKLIEKTSGSGMRDAVDKDVAKERTYHRVALEQTRVSKVKKPVIPHPYVPLEQMWHAIVEPVITHLGLQVRDDCLLILLL